MVCGKKVKSDQIIKRWDGVLVCKDDYEPRHSLDFIRVPTERGAVPYVSPEPADTFTGPTCPYPTQYAMADIGTADCAMADSITTTLIPTMTAGVAIAEIAISNINYAAQGPLL